MDTIQLIVVHAIPLIFAITFHEVAHGWVAERFGDPTARMMGRITPNPLNHVDPVGTVLVPFFLLAVNAGVLFGWARPVPVNYSNLRHPRLHSMWVALAGPGSNFLQFLFWGILILVIRETIGYPDAAATDNVSRIVAPLVLMASAGLFWNFWLGLLNLMPILPLDGGRVLNSVLPPRLAEAHSRTESFGFVIVIGLFYFFGHHLSFLLTPLFWVRALLGVS
jgi:Zn-dependent protease